MNRQHHYAGACYFKAKICEKNNRKNALTNYYKVKEIREKRERWLMEEGIGSEDIQEKILYEIENELDDFVQKPTDYYIEAKCRLDSL